MPAALLLPTALSEALDDELKAEGWESMPTKGETVEIPDSLVDGYFAMAEHVDRRCPECRRFLVIDHDTDAAECPKCGWREGE